MEKYLFIALIVLIVGFWLAKTRELLHLFRRIEEMKQWPSTTASIEWIHFQGNNDGGKPKFFRSLFRKAFSLEAYHVLAIFRVGDLRVGATTFSAFKRMSAAHRLFVRKLIRSGASEVQVYYDPNNPEDSVILPPSEHRLRIPIVKHAVYTVVVNFSVVILVA